MLSVSFKRHSLCSKKFRFLSAALTAALTVSCGVGGDGQDPVHALAASPGSMATLVGDSLVKSASPTANFGGETRLEADQSPKVRSYLKFDLGQVAAAGAQATLRLYVRNPTWKAPSLHRVDNGWDENSVTWNKGPSRSGAAVEGPGKIAGGTWIEYDVSGAITGSDEISFELATDKTDGATFDSREGEFPPELWVDGIGAGAPSPVEQPTTPEPSRIASLEVEFVPQSGVSGSEVVNFALPLAEGLLYDEDNVRVIREGREVSSARRGLSKYSDGSYRSVQIQAEFSFSGPLSAEIEVGAPAALGSRSMQSVQSTLTTSKGVEVPRIWTKLPPSWLTPSGVAGRLDESSQAHGASAAWDDVCDYERFDYDAFDALDDAKNMWLYDRVTVNYRGYVRQGTTTPLQTAYREAHRYRDGITGSGSSTRIGIPGVASDVKYHYTQGMSIHYLLTGDDRFRESVEDIATRITSLWSSPRYNGGADFWTERHAGFALLGYTWAARVSDDQASTFVGEADVAVDAYLALQAKYPTWWNDSSARCFAHTAESHGESLDSWGCSPWMSSILADGLDTYATYRGGSRATQVKQAIVRLGRMIAAEGLDSSGKPLYWLGVGGEDDMQDDYDEHWGESAYVVALAWHHAGRSDSALLNTARELVQGFADNASAPHLRSFNWQCRTAVQTSSLLP